ncbi:MAG: glycosyltransferase family 39 protein [Candidatus Koribacter versatilis]|uniref:Glycosyltransferase family 39 protein n=1 Tax=Candidatus Korobacter versatilis TaxID=658062 RepID=A0A932A9U5_9BACT|nr:glycosyltransferase family 39 protein [Candidatus Koribacter versatilis]
MRDRNLLIEIATVAGFCAFLQYFGAAAIGLTGADEPRYAQIAREMLARGDWVTPVLYGHAWFEKPVLYCWSAMVSYKMFGVSDWAARLPAATFATAAVFGVYAFLRRFARGAELDGALMTASPVALIGFARSAGPDMLLAASFTLAMLGWMAWRLTLTAEAQERRWLLVFYFFSAAGMLAKGPVAPALAGLVVVVFALVRREPRTILRTLWLPGIALFLLVALPWYVVVQMRNPEFFRAFIIEHNVARFATNLYQHRQPFWYYVPVILLGTLPWTVYWLAAVVEAAPRLWRPLGGERATTPLAAGERATTAMLQQFLLVWMFAVVGFFSIAQSKLPGYILPALPACTVLVADYVERKRAEKGNFTLLTLHAGILAVLVAGVLLVPYAMAQAANAPRVTAGVLAMLVFLGVAFTVYRRGLRLLRFATVAPLLVLLAFLLRLGAPVLDAKVSYRQAAAALDALDNRSSKVAIYKVRREAGYGIAYYRGQPVVWYEPTYFDQPAGIPPGDHMVVGPAGAEEGIARAAGGRRVSRVGEYAPQKLVFYWVSANPVHGGQSTVHSGPKPVHSGQSAVDRGR